MSEGGGSLALVVVSVLVVGDLLVDVVARRGGGRVVAPTADGLGAAVVGDYLRAKRK